MKKHVVRWIFLLILFMSIVTTVLAQGDTQEGDSLPYCEGSHSEQVAPGIGRLTAPLCGHDTSWTSQVEADYIVPSMTKLGLKTIHWTDAYGRGNGIRRIFHSAKIDLTGRAVEPFGGNAIGAYDAHLFTGEYTWYIVGTQITWGPGYYSHACGFQLVRTSLENFYLITINQYRGEDGHVGYSKMYAGNVAEKPSGWVDVSNVLSTGYSSKNTLIIYVLRDWFYVFVNGNRVAQFQDDTFMDVPGYVGLFMNTLPNIPGENVIPKFVSEVTYCTFDQAWIWPVTDWEWE